jgi:hypothetical protein
MPEQPDVLESGDVTLRIQTTLAAPAIGIEKQQGGWNGTAIKWTVRTGQPSSSSWDGKAIRIYGGPKAGGKLERAGTSWNELERAGTSWNELERAGTSWNELERAGTRQPSS